MVSKYAVCNNVVLVIITTGGSDCQGNNVRVCMWPISGIRAHVVSVASLLPPTSTDYLHDHTLCECVMV